jgi:hypothetical protein
MFSAYRSVPHMLRVERPSVRIPEETRYFSIHLHIPTGSEAHPEICFMVIGGAFFGGKAGGT